MSRLKRIQNIDGLLNALTIASNQCSLSEKDAYLFNIAIEKLNRLRKKKGLTDKHFKDETSDIVGLLLKFLNY